MLEKIQNFRETGIIAGQFASGGKATDRPIPYQYGLSLSFNAKIIKEPCIFCIQIFILALCNFDGLNLLFCPEQPNLELCRIQYGVGHPVIRIKKTNSSMLRVAETDLNMQLALDYQHREHSLVLPQAVVVNTRPIQIKKLFTYILLNT